MAKARILIAATDADLRGTLARWLMASGYGVELAESPRRAREVVATEPIALAIVAPHGFAETGEDVARELGDLVGALITVQETDSEEAAAGAAEGSILKPLRQDDVLARVKAALTMPASDTAGAVPEVLGFEGFVLDVGGRACRDALGRDVPLTRAEFTLLVALARQPGRVFARDQLRQAVSGRGGTEADERSIDVLVSRLRRKIEADSKDPRIIVTVPGGGYKFTPVPQTAPPSLAPAESQPARPAAAAMSSTSDVSAPAAPSPRLSGAAVQSTIRGVLAAPRKVWIASVAAACTAIALVGALVWTTTNRRDASFNLAGTFDVAAVPMIGGGLRRDLAAYPQQPDFKAVAISGTAVGVAFGATSREIAETEALERCKARTNLTRSGPCGLYAVGMDVVWSPKSIPMPLPGDFHDESPGEPLRAVDLPLLGDDARKKVDAEYFANDSRRALAIAAKNPPAAYWTVRIDKSDGQASVRVVQKCGHLHQVPCLLVSVDGMRTVRIPKSRRITGLFMVTTEPQMSAADRQRVDEIYRQKEWRALARGKSGAWYPVANSPSEEAAVAAALSACTQSDSDCRLYAIGNFRIADSN